MLTCRLTSNCTTTMWILFAHNTLIPLCPTCAYVTYAPSSFHNCTPARAPLDTLTLRCHTCCLTFAFMHHLLLVEYFSQIIWVYYLDITLLCCPSDPRAQKALARILSGCPGFPVRIAAPVCIILHNSIQSASTKGTRHNWVLWLNLGARVSRCGSQFRYVSFYIISVPVK
jgi:hypothetical protein